MRGEKMSIIGIREEDKSIFERRVPIVPENIEELVKKGYKVIIEPSAHRVFKEEEFKKAGAIVSKDLSEAKVIFGVKEIPPKKLLKNKTYMFFSHTIKGQSYNMPLLKKLLEQKDTLIDYERVVDENGRRLIFFGKFAGFAGAIDALHLLGQKLKLNGLSTPFEKIKRAYDYNSLEDAKTAIKEIGKTLKKEGIPENLKPFVIGFAGYGNVSRGAQEIMDELSTVEISPSDLLEGNFDEKSDNIYKVVFKEEDMVEPVNPSDKFELMDYYKYPEKYRGVFSKYIPFLSLLVNAIYWEEKYPRLITNKDIKNLWQQGIKKLILIADISCDINGAIEFTYECGEPDKPALIYEPLKERYHLGIDGDGPVVLMVDILPSELPREASLYFSKILEEFIPAILDADYSVDFNNLNLPSPIKKAVIVHRGELTPDYRYLKQFIKNL
jgi:alpha-aminoadipic semialdehyde synthase